MCTLNLKDSVLNRTTRPAAAFQPRQQQAGVIIRPQITNNRHHSPVLPLLNTQPQ
jgi:hypothetical protein